MPQMVIDYPRAKMGGLDALYVHLYTCSISIHWGYAKKFADSLIYMTKQLAEIYPDQFAMAYTG